MGGTCGKQKSGKDRKRTNSAASAAESRKSISTVDPSGCSSGEDEEVEDFDGSTTQDSKFTNLRKIDKVSSISSIKRDLRKKETLINRIIGASGGEQKRYHGKPRLSLMHVPHDVQVEHGSAVSGVDTAGNQHGDQQNPHRVTKRQMTVA